MGLAVQQLFFFFPAFRGDWMLKKVMSMSSRSRGNVRPAEIRCTKLCSSCLVGAEDEDDASAGGLAGRFAPTAGSPS